MKKFTKTVALMLACMFLLSFSLIGCKTDSGEDGKLAQTASITYADGTLSWAAVEGAESYDVTVYEKGSSEEALETQTVTKTTLDVSLLAAGEYTAGVIAKAEGKTAGDEKKADFTVAEALSALDTPTGFAYADGKVTWTAVAGAKSGYNVTVTKKSDGSSVINKDVTAAELDVSELKMACSLLFTLPGVPFVYAGDEIGMRHLFLPSKEGGYDRTGDRTPLQWDHTPQYGFSTCPDTYLPQDMASDAPTVADQEAEEGSLLRYVRALLTFRRNTPELQADAPFEPVWMGQGGYPFVYRRGGLMLALNAAADAREIPFPVGDPLFLAGKISPTDAGARLDGQSFVIWRA